MSKNYSFYKYSVWSLSWLFRMYEIILGKGSAAPESLTNTGVEFLKMVPLERSIVVPRLTRTNYVYREYLRKRRR
jgi:hypothetical protein